MDLDMQQITNKIKQLDRQIIRLNKLQQSSIIRIAYQKLYKDAETGYFLNKIFNGYNDDTVRIMLMEKKYYSDMLDFLNFIYQKN